MRMNYKKLFVRITILLINLVYCTGQGVDPSPQPPQPPPPQPPPPPPAFDLKPVAVKYGDVCDYKIYSQFVTETQNSNITHTLNFVYYELSKSYFEYLDKICIEVSQDLVIDPHKFDCVKRKGKEMCSCGYKMYKVDPLMSSSLMTVTYNEHKYRTYLKVIGLDRRLVLEHEECLSGTHGHCTLPTDVEQRKSKGAEMVLQCRDKHECRTTWRKITNKKTREVYGTCETKESNTEELPKGTATSILWTYEKVVWMTMIFIIFILQL